MKRYSHLYEKICTMDNLEWALERAAKGKKYKKSVRYVLAHKQEHLERLQGILLTHSFHTHKYRVKTVHEPKERIIYILPFYPDRIVHHAIMNVLEPIFESFFINDSYACRSGKGQHLGSFRCMEFVRRNPYVIQCDVSKFYPSIPHDKLKAVLLRKFKDKALLDLLSDIIDSADGVPIGNYISQWLGNLYMNELDQYVKQQLHVKDYFRYCDDFFLFGTKERMKEIRPLVVSYVGDTLGMKLSKCLLYPTSHGVDSLGYRHFPNGKILLRKSTAKRIRTRMKGLPHALRIGEVAVERAEGQIASAWGCLKHANTFHLRYQLNLGELRKLVNDYGTVQRLQQRGCA